MSDSFDPASEPDDENPEWTREDVRNARPALETIREIFGEEAAEMLRQLSTKRDPK